MRRKDREITDINCVFNILERAKVMRLALAEKYMIPLCYGYEKHNDTFTLYFHSGAKGRKNEILEKDNEVGFEIEGRFELVPSDIACRYSYQYESIIGLGEVIKLEGEKKRRAMNLIMDHIGGKKDWSYIEPIFKITDVYKVEVKEFECKSNCK